MSRIQFDARFLKSALLRLIIEPHLIEKFRSLITPEMFDIQDEYGTIKRIAKIVLDRSKSENVTAEGVASWLQLMSGGPEREATIDAFDALRIDDFIVKHARSDQVFETFLQYLKAVTFLNSHEGVKEAFNNANFEAAYTQFEKALTKIKGISMEDDNVVNWKSSIEFLENSANTSFGNFGFGITDFDENGGFEKQSMNMFLSTSSGGKTMMTVHLIREAIRQGKKIFVACVEDKQTTILRRLYAAETGLEINQLKNYQNMPPEDRARILKAREKIEKYVYLCFPYDKSHKYILEKFKELNERCKIEGIPEYEVFVLDYIQHIGHRAAGDSLHEKLHRANSDLKDFALKHDKIVFTHFQVNRSGAARVSEDGLIDMSVIAGAYNACFVADNIVSINRSPQQMNDNLCTLYVVKGREGAMGRKYEVPTDFAKARFKTEQAKIIKFETF